MTKFSQINPGGSVNFTTDFLIGVQSSNTTDARVTPTQLFSSFPVFGASNTGIVPASGGGIGNFLRSDGTWASSSSGGGTLAPIITSVRSSAAATVTASATTDYFLALDPTSNAITVNLPASPATGLSFLIKDATGQAASHNITVVPASGNIDGVANYVINNPFQSVAVTYTGAQWSLN